MAAQATQLRKNPFDDEWVMYAPHRAQVRSLPDSDGSDVAPSPCPFCVGAAEVPDEYEVLVLENRFPSFSVSPSPVTPAVDAMEGYGRQQVFLFSPSHHARLADQSTERIGLLLRELGRQTLALYEDPRIEAVVSFENSGPIFGPSVAHPHGQTFAVPFVPKRMGAATDNCILCPLGDGALAQHRVASLESAGLACMPHARLPFEMTIAPSMHAGLLADLDDSVLADLAALVRAGLRALDVATGNGTPYMLLLYQAPRPLRGRYHLRIEIVPVAKPSGGLKYLGGLELGFGVFVNPSLPEQSAAILRNAIDFDFE